MPRTGSKTAPDESGRFAFIAKAITRGQPSRRSFYGFRRFARTATSPRRRPYAASTASSSRPLRLKDCRVRATSFSSIGKAAPSPRGRTSPASSSSAKPPRACTRMFAAGGGPLGSSAISWDFETSLGSRPHWGYWKNGMGMTAEAMQAFSETVAQIKQRLEAFAHPPSGLTWCMAICALRTF